PQPRARARRDDAPRQHVPGHQELRVLAQVPGRHGARAALHLRGPRGEAGGAVPLDLLHDDRVARAAHGDRHRHHGVAPARRARRPVRARVPQPGRGGRALLALRRRGLDIPLPAPLPDRSALMDEQHASHAPSASVTSYVVVFLVLMALTALTTRIAFIDLGRLNTVVMLSIAVTKAVVVAVFFMHLRQTTQLTRLAAVAGLAWLALPVAGPLRAALT